MFFVVSTGRSGTTTVAGWLNQVAGLRCVHEPQPVLISESADYRYGKVSQDDVCKLLRSTRAPTADGREYGESNQCLALLIPALAATFSDASYLWLVRDARAVVASAMQKYWYSGRSENHERYEDCPPIERMWIDGRVRADLVGEATASEWEAWSRFEKCCWYWAYVNRVIEQDLQGQPRHRWIRVRLEDLPAQAPRVITFLTGRTDGTATVPHLNQAKREPYSTDQWTEADRAAFERHCGSTMDTLYPGWRRGG